LRPARLARLAPFALVAHALLLLWLSWTKDLDSSRVLAALLVVVVIVGAIETAAIVAVANQPRSIAALVGAAGWALGWLLHAASLLAVTALLLGMRAIGDFAHVERSATYASTIGGFVFAVACALRVDVSKRRLVLLFVAFYGLLAFVAAWSERRLLDAPIDVLDMSRWESLRLARDISGAVWLFALAALLHYCERHKPADPVPRAKLVS
jgi:hypothetical protein